MKLCRVCGVEGRALCFSCLGKISAASPKSKAALARRNGSPEGKAHLETWNGSPEGKAQLVRLHETWLGSPEQKAALARAGKKSRETWLGSPEQKVALARGRKKLAAKPTWPEARFYGLIFGWFNGALKDFRFQEVIPTENCNHRVDARWDKTIFELDGGGHHVFKDRHEHDRLVDSDYSAMGYRVVRASNANDLFLRVLQMVERLLTVVD